MGVRRDVCKDKGANPRQHGQWKKGKGKGVRQKNKMMIHLFHPPSLQAGSEEAILVSSRG